jgi:hypothetical protein
VEIVRDGLVLAQVPLRLRVVLPLPAGDIVGAGGLTIGGAKGGPSIILEFGDAERCIIRREVQLAKPVQIARQLL